MSDNATGNGKAAFGPVKETNKNWIALVAELKGWREKNKGNTWPEPQGYARLFNNHWQKFATFEF